MRQPFTQLRIGGDYFDPRAVRTLEGVRVLIVDDNRDTLSMLAAHLTDHKAEVETATSVAEALEILRTYQPQVLVSDVAMPDEDGYSLISRIRQSEAGGDSLPAIALTALARVEDRARALSAGFNMFVPKPFEPSELVAAIAHLTHIDSVP
jgi:CheY-like chemotaxis protein